MIATHPPLRAMLDRLAIRELIENWVISRDTGDWERLASLWHEDGRMVTTWCEVGAAEFVALARKTWANAAVSAVHAMGGTSIDVSGARAVAQSRMTLTQRAPLHGVLVDVTCTGYFFDLLEQRMGRWGLVLRHPIYEADRIDVVDPSLTLQPLDGELLGRFPAGYRHLGYLQTQMGLHVNTELPGRVGPAVEALRERGRRWLAGADTAGDVFTPRSEKSS
jgi:hypothetical protein